MANKNPPKSDDTPDKEKTALYISTESIKALKYIAFTDDVTRTDIINEALTEYIARWEKKNGLIPKKG